MKERDNVGAQQDWGSAARTWKKGERASSDVWRFPDVQLWGRQGWGGTQGGREVRHERLKKVTKTFPYVSNEEYYSRERGKFRQVPTQECASRPRLVALAAPGACRLETNSGERGVGIFRPTIHPLGETESGKR